MAAMGRLAVIADDLSAQLEVSDLDLAYQVRCAGAAVRAALKTYLQPWLDGSHPNAFVYDLAWGGVLARETLKDKKYDFGAGLYNDHHFQW